MDKADFLPRELANCENRWRSDGDISAVVEAVALCGWNGWPLPEWCVDPVCEALFVFNETGQRGQGTPRTRHAAVRHDKVRHDLLARILASPMDATGKQSVTVDEAAEIAARWLKHQNVEAGTVKASYYKVRRTLK